MSKVYPVLYATSVVGTLFKHCSVHPTIYFKLNIDDELAKTDSQYLDYMEKIQEECIVNIINKFTFSQALKVTNNRIDFIIFRGNVDVGAIKQFCQVLLDEVAYFTKKKHTADFMTTDTLFMQIDRKPTFLKAASVGDKLSETDFMKDYGMIMESSDNPEDSGWLTEFIVFKNGETPQDESEQVVAW